LRHAFARTHLARTEKSRLTAGFSCSDSHASAALAVDLLAGHALMVGILLLLAGFLAAALLLLTGLLPWILVLLTRLLAGVTLVLIGHS
jgi:hypothetical protein